MNKFPFLSASQALIIFRIAVAGLLMAHGWIRLLTDNVNGFGVFLDGKGFMIGTAIAWFLTIFEIVGGLLMALGYFTRWVAVIFIIEHCFGIILVHAPNGWYTVGYQQGGVEYSVLIIFSLVLIAAAARSRRLKV